MIDRLNGSPTPRFYGVHSKNGCYLFAGEAVIGTYRTLTPTFYEGKSTDGQLTVMGDRLADIAQAIWLVERGSQIV